MRFITIILLLAITPHALAEQGQSASPDTNQQATKQQTENQNTEPEPIPPVAPLPPANEKEAPPNDASGNGNDEATTQDGPSELASFYVAHQDLLEQASMADAAWWVVVCSVIGVVIGFATLILLGFTVFYAKRAAESTEEALEQARLTLAEGQKATEAAQRAAEAAATQAQQNRAWVTFDPNATTKEAHEDLGEVLALTFRNFGATPAIDVAIKWRRTELTDHWVTAGDTPFGKEMYSGIVSPGAEIKHRSNIAQDDIVQLTYNNKKFAYFYEVTYKTIYDQETRVTRHKFDVHRAETDDGTGGYWVIPATGYDYIT